MSKMKKIKLMEGISVKKDKKPGTIPAIERGEKDALLVACPDAPRITRHSVSEMMEYIKRKGE